LLQEYLDAVALWKSIAYFFFVAAHAALQNQLQRWLYGRKCSRHLLNASHFLAIPSQRNCGFL
jgi:hypothetical protein